MEQEDSQGRCPWRPGGPQVSLAISSLTPAVMCGVLTAECVRAGGVTSMGLSMRCMFLEDEL